MSMLDISQAGSFFPMNVVDVLVHELQAIGPPSAPGAEDGVRVYPRPLGDDAKTQTIGVYPDIRSFDEDSLEIGNREPTVKRYSIIIETHIQGHDRADAVKLHGMIVALVDHVLYRADTLVGALVQLSSTAFGVTTTYFRHGVGSQQYLTGGGGTTTVFRSMTEFWIETQTN